MQDLFEKFSHFRSRFPGGNDGAGQGIRGFGFLIPCQQIGDHCLFVVAVVSEFPGGNQVCQENHIVKKETLPQVPIVCRVFVCVPLFFADISAIHKEAYGSRIFLGKRACRIFRPDFFIERGEKAVHIPVLEFRFDCLHDFIIFPGIQGEAVTGLGTALFPYGDGPQNGGELKAVRQIQAFRIGLKGKPGDGALFRVADLRAFQRVFHKLFQIGHDIVALCPADAESYVISCGCEIFELSGIRFQFLLQIRKRCLQVREEFDLIFPDRFPFL